MNRTTSRRIQSTEEKLKDMDEEFVVGFIKDEPDGLTPIDIVMDVTGLTYDEVKSCCEIIKINDDLDKDI